MNELPPLFTMPFSFRVDNSFGDSEARMFASLWLGAVASASISDAAVQGPKFY